MKVYFDSQISLLQKDGGISAYFKNLRKSLAPQLPPGNVIASEPRKVVAGKFQVASGVWSIGENFPKYADVYHPTYYGPQWAGYTRPRGAKMVVTIFDMIPEEEKSAWYQNPHFAKRAYMEKADLIIVPSQNTAKSVEVFGFQATVIPLASPLVTRAEDTRINSERSGLLFVGKRSGYKNFTGLLRTLALTDPTLTLTVFGGGPSTAAERSLIDSLGLCDRVMWSASSSSESLERLYLSSSLNVIPSKREGFGLTQLEAMQHGCVNFLNDIPVLQEVSGDSAVFSDFENLRQTADSLQRLYFDTNRLQKIRESGLDHERKFTWERVATETLSAYQRVLQS